jgi:uncharacterized protein YndB with AHSA1/START domain
MEQKTKINAEEGKQEIVITREFDLPLELLFKAYSEPEFIEQWMGTKVIIHENKKHGSYRFETKDGNGIIVFSANGVIHDFVINQKITRTFEMENAPFEVQLDFLEFVKLTDTTSKLSIQTIYKSVEHRDQLLKLPFAYGLNMAHDRLQDILKKQN